MYEYIINPVWFYLMNTINSIGTMLLVIGIGGAIFSIIAYLVPTLSSYEDGCELDDREKVFVKNAKKLIIVFAIIIFIGVVLPSKKVIIEMMIAKTATKSNVGTAIEAIENAAKSIIESVK